MFRKKRKLDKVISGLSVGEKKGGKLLTIILIILAVILVAGVAFLAYGYYNTQKELKMLKDPKQAEALAQKEVQKVIAKVAMHMILPTGEEPTLASITDIAALKKEQPFYEGAENGDQILVYKNAKIGIVYSPTKDRIVKVGPVVIQDTQNGTDTTATDTTSSSTPSSLKPSDNSSDSSSNSNTNNNLYNQFNTGQ